MRALNELRMAGLFSVLFTIASAVIVATLTIIVAALVAGSVVVLLVAAPAIAARRTMRRGHIHLLRVLLQLPFLIVSEIVENRCRMVESMNNFQDLEPLRVWHLLHVTRIRHRFVLIVLQANVAQLCVGHIFHIEPLHLELALPFVLVPDGRYRIIVDG